MNWFRPGSPEAPHAQMLDSELADGDWQEHDREQELMDQIGASNLYPESPLCASFDDDQVIANSNGT